MARDDMHEFFSRRNKTVGMVKEFMDNHSADELRGDPLSHSLFGDAALHPCYDQDLFIEAAELDDVTLMDLVTDYLNFSDDDIKGISFGTASGDGDILLFAMADEKYNLLNWLIESRKIYNITELYEEEENPECLAEMITNARLSKNDDILT